MQSRAWRKDEHDKDALKGNLKDDQPCTPLGPRAHPPLGYILGEKPVFKELLYAREKYPKHLGFIYFYFFPRNSAEFLEDLHIYIWLLSREKLFLSHLHCIFSSDINMN